MANGAFERDLEEGLEEGHSRRARHRHSTPRKQTGAKSTTASSLSHSSTCKTGGSDEELSPTDGDGESDHESVVLDSDQELLGFDSTGTPIIATHTRTRAGAGAGSASRAMPDLSATAATTATEASSPTTPTTATTVINMSQGATGPPSSKTPAAPPPLQPPAARAAVQSALAAGERSREGASGDDHAQLQVTTGDVNEPNNTKSASVELGAKQQPDDHRAGSTTTTRAQPGARRPTNGGDLMSELNERLGSANKQRRTLRRQVSADADGELASQGRQVESALPPLAPAPGKRTGLAEQRSRTAGEREDPKQQSTSTAAAAAAAAQKQPEASEATPDASQGARGRRQEFAASSRASESMSCLSTVSRDTLEGASNLRDMKNAELLEKQSIFAMTYSGLATDKLPGR